MEWATIASVWVGNFVFYCVMVWSVLVAFRKKQKSRPSADAAAGVRDPNAE
jgi:hypothetical protein